MNKVRNLQSRLSASYPWVKRLGPDRPDISARSSSCSPRFTKIWYSKYNWLTGYDESGKVYCFPSVIHHWVWFHCFRENSMLKNWPRPSFLPAIWPRPLFNFWPPKEKSHQPPLTMDLTDPKSFANAWGTIKLLYYHLNPIWKTLKTFNSQYSYDL